MHLGKAYRRKLQVHHLHIMAKPTSGINSETDLLICPYNKSHLIIPQRFQVHLVRCRRSYPNSPVVVCPFNVTHRVNKAELKWHVSSCPNRQYFENLRYRDAPNPGLSSTFCAEGGGNATALNNTSTVASSNIKGGEYVESSECWDDEPDHPGYNPREYIEKADVLRLPVGMTPSERKAFRLAERKRLQNLQK